MTRANPQQGSSGPKRIKKPVLVPNIKQPLFDALSKAQLKPGTEITQHKVDDTWLIQKHRDTLLDFTDVEPSEKEYMVEWDKFVLTRHVSHEKYIPKAFVAFLKEKALWIVATPTRPQELAKHAALLLARNAISPAVFAEATQIIADARNKKPESAQPVKRALSADSCARCHQAVPMSEMMICRHKVRSLLALSPPNHDGRLHDRATTLIFEPDIALV